MPAMHWEVPEKKGTELEQGGLRGHGVGLKRAFQKPKTLQSHPQGVRAKLSSWVGTAGHLERCAVVVNPARVFI